MTSAHVVSVNLGRPRSIDGIKDPTAIDKHEVDSARVGFLGLEGDEVADTRYHGGTYMAVYAFAREDLGRWTRRLGRPVRPGLFGENLTTAGIDVNEALVGEIWRVGTALLEVVSVRTPCGTFQRWMTRNGFPERGWVKRFTEDARPGPYLRVRETGLVSVGDPVVVEHRPDHDVTVSTMFRAMTTERSLLPRLLDLGDIDPVVIAEAERYLAKAPATTGPSVSA